MPGIPQQIPGFGASNRLPMVAGTVQTGVGGQSAASLPKSILLVALGSGSLTPDTQAQLMLSPGDGDNYAGLGTELGCLVQDTLTVAGASGAKIYAITPTPAGGATPATTVIKFAGSPNSTQQVSVRIAGTLISALLPALSSAAQCATLLASAINGALSGRLPVSASATGAYLTITNKTLGIRGNQQVVFLDVTQLVGGLTATLYVTWGATIAYAVGDQVVPTTADGLYFRCTTPGTSAGSQPTWPTTPGQTVTDGSVTWTCVGSTATGNLPTTALYLGLGAGLETYTNLLVAISGTAYDRIILACNDAVSLAAWKTQLDQLEAAPYNLLQQAVVAFNGSNAAATSLAQTTLNDALFQFMWQLNGEMQPSRVAAQFGSIRAFTEQQNPNAEYDGMILPFVAPQTQPADYPNIPTLISSINNSLTVVTSGNYGLGPGNDGYARVVRSITTKSLTNGSADFSSMDTGIITTAQFVWTDAKIYYQGTLQPANPDVADDYPSNQKPPPSGVLQPRSASSAFNGRLVRFSQGNLSSAPVAGSATIPPIILPPLPGDVNSVFDPNARRIVTTEIIRVMPINHQLGIIVQAAA